MCVRNPIEVFYSLATLVNTLSHAYEFEQEFDSHCPEWWDWWVHERAADHARYKQIQIN